MTCIHFPVYRTFNTKYGEFEIQFCWIIMGKYGFLFDIKIYTTFSWKGCNGNLEQPSLSLWKDINNNNKIIIFQLLCQQGYQANKVKLTVQFPTYTQPGHDYSISIVNKDSRPNDFIQKVLRCMELNKLKF